LRRPVSINRNKSLEKVNSGTPPESPSIVSSSHVTILQHRGVSCYRSQSDFLVGLGKIPLSASVLYQRGAKGDVRLREIECPEKNWDFGRKAKGFASRVVFGRFQVCRGRTGYRRPLQQESDSSLLRDELCKTRSGPKEFTYSHRLRFRWIEPTIKSGDGSKGGRSPRQAQPTHPALGRIPHRHVPRLPVQLAPISPGELGGSARRFPPMGELPALVQVVEDGNRHPGKEKGCHLSGHEGDGEPWKMGSKRITERPPPRRRR